MLIRICLAALALLAGASALARPSAWGRNTAAALLPVDEAFQLLPAERRGATLHVEWNIAPGYYLYRERLGVEVIGPASARLGKVKLPHGEKHHDEHFGDVEIYRGIVGADYALSGKLRAPLRLRINYQGCADLGVCYPPQVREIEAEVAR
ncbi:MAG TPA: protein-disulfide reductase DsbD N-terminal domain-containing protein [Solimonas sp.]|nr:protein-disulfide reductase DsbD N-terminal domain-containing protein [Solimonas sp.]